MKYNLTSQEAIAHVLEDGGEGKGFIIKYTESTCIVIEEEEEENHDMRDTLLILSDKILKVGYREGRVGKQLILPVLEWVGLKLIPFTTKNGLFFNITIGGVTIIAVEGKRCLKIFKYAISEELCKEVHHYYWEALDEGLYPTNKDTVLVMQGDNFRELYISKEVGKSIIQQIEVLILLTEDINMVQRQKVKGL